MRLVTCLWVCAVALGAFAGCGERKEAGGTDESMALPDVVPKGYPMPPGGVVTDTRKVGASTNVVVVYKGGSVADIAASLRTQLRDGGWDVVHDDVQGHRHFVSVQRGDKILAATVFAAPDPTITLAVSPAPTQPPVPPTQTATPAQLLEGFPAPAGAVRDSGYPPAPGPLPARLFHAKDRSPADVLAWLPDAAATAGWACTVLSDPNKYNCRREGASHEIVVRAVAHPNGGTALFQSVVPGG